MEWPEGKHARAGFEFQNKARCQQEAQHFDPKKLSDSKAMSWTRAHRSMATDQSSFSVRHMPRSAQSSLDPMPYLCLFSMVVQAQMGGQVHIGRQEFSLKVESGLHSLRERKRLGLAQQQLLHIQPP